MEKTRSTQCFKALPVTVITTPERITVTGNALKHCVLQSIARDRYYYAGENKFANLGSSGADDSVDITVQYAGGTLTDIGIVTDPADYVQMELTPMREWIQTIGLPGCPDV